MKLQSLAREKGFTLVQIFDQRNVAARLYRESRWRLDLLDLPGSPSALSVVPATRRPMMDLEPLGREADLRWLRETRGDRILTGEPGSGKTFLLRHLMLQGWAGLFLTSDDQGLVADALREQQPRVVVVDDAHVAPYRIDNLRRLREETGARFDILATTWNGARDLVAEVLGGLPESRIRKLELLTRDEILEIEAGAAADLVHPFLQAAIRLARPGWEPLLERCLGSDRLDLLGMELTLREEEVSDHLLAVALERLPRAIQLIEALCLRNEVSPARIAVLLNHPDEKTALAAAVGEWLSKPMEQVRGELLDAWREAILRSAGEDDLEAPGLGYWLGVILAKSPGLALDWLRLFLRDTGRHFRFTLEKIAMKALSDLGKVERALLLQEIQGDSLPRGFLSSLIGRDEDLYRQLLASSAARSHHLAPLGGLPDESWLPLALAALDHGYSPAEIASATAWSSSSRISSGPMGERWRGLDEAFSRFEGHERKDLQEAAREGRRLALEQIEISENEYRKRAVHGD